MKYAILLLSMISCHEEVKDKECIEKAPAEDYACYQIYQPVCGCNNKTYSNDCEANARGIKIIAQGECPDK